jgi:glycosyltransferase involved in cell wall biosynthesis
MSAIRLILQARVNLLSKPGGDTIQINDLKDGLIRRGLRVGISTELKPRLDSYDIVHIFNITRVHETYIQLANAKQQRKPVVCSTIYHPLEEYNRKGRYGLGRLAFKFVRNDQGIEYVRGFFNTLRDWRQSPSILKQWAIGYRKQQELVLAGADKIIFGSASEKQSAFSHFNGIAPRIDYDIIKIGLSPSLQAGDARFFEERYGLRNFVLCVGRIEDLKNQLNLVKAMEGLGMPMVFVGSLNSAHRGYGKKVLREISKRDNCHFLGQLSREILASAYAAAKVHVLPSWFETTGLSSMEAGAAGCNIVSTDRGYAGDYFKDFAWYCDPSDLLSIRNAVTAAYDSPIRPGLGTHIRRKLSFQKMLDRFIQVYHELV